MIIHWIIHLCVHCVTYHITVHQTLLVRCCVWGSLCGGHMEFNQRGSCKVRSGTHFFSAFENSLHSWTVACVYTQQDKYTLHTHISTWVLRVRAAFLGQSRSLNGVINRVPWVPASLPTWRFLMNHATVQHRSHTNLMLAWPFNPANHFHRLLWTHTPTTCQYIHSLPLGHQTRGQHVTGLCFYPLFSVFFFFSPSSWCSTMHIGAALHSFKGL